MHFNLVSYWTTYWKCRNAILNEISRFSLEFALFSEMLNSFPIFLSLNISHIFNHSTKQSFSHFEQSVIFVRSEHRRRSLSEFSWFCLTDEINASQPSMTVHVFTSFRKLKLFNNNNQNELQVRDSLLNTIIKHNFQLIERVRYKHY